VGVSLLLLACAAILAMMKTLPPLLTAHTKVRGKTPVIPRYPTAAQRHP
jgi:hypothetical protein